MSIIEKVVDIPAEHSSNIFGSCDAYVKKIERTLKVTIIARDSEIKLVGAEGAVTRAAAVFAQLLELARRGNTITEQNVDYAISLAFDDKAEAISELDADVIARTVLGKPIKPKTIGQKEYVDAIKKRMIVFGVGPGRHG